MQLYIKILKENAGNVIENLMRKTKVVAHVLVKVLIYRILFIINAIVGVGKNMFKNNYIHELELNFSNICGANCIMCSRPHGCDNEDIMQPKIFNILVDQLKDVKFDIIQTSGDGETFMNLHYINYIRTLKREFPNTPRWIYNNFSMLNNNIANIIVTEDLFNRVHTRVDSLHEWIFTKSSMLNMEIVLKNIKYFLSINHKIPFTILYNNIVDYYNRCKAVFGDRPIRDRFNDIELSQIKNEQNEIREYFINDMHNPELLSMARINHGLWGERYRDDIEHNPFYPCPKIKVIEQVCWIYPNGNIGMCCYEDRQTEGFSLGNIQNEHILDIFYGEKRRQAIENIKNNVYKDYPCNDPRLCGFGDGVENKKGV